MKRSLLVGLTTLLALSACTKIVVPEPKPFPEIPTVESIPLPAAHGTVSHVDTQPTWTTNNIIDHWNGQVQTETDEGVLITVNAYTYSGLKDEALMALVNQTISDKIEALKHYAKFENLPVYPGFYAAFPEGQREITHLTIDANARFNVCNILSVSFWVQVSFKSSGSEQRQVVISDALNIDLTTGQQLSLADLFVNDSDYPSLLNQIILLKSQGKTDPISDEMSGLLDPYVYHGGFTGIRGDVKFSLSQTDLTLYFNENYTEFSNEYSTVTLTIPWTQLQSLLAFGQRFTQGETWIYSDPIIGKARNYLYVVEDNTKPWTLNDVKISSTFTLDEQLSEAYQAMALKALEKDRLAVEALANGSVVELSHVFSAFVMGPYMNLISTTAISGDNWEMIGWSATIKPDGTPLTMDDLFKDGFDYRSFIKDLIADQIRDYEFQNTYDLDQVYETLVSNLLLGSSGSSQFITMTNEYYFDASLDEGDFTIFLDLDANKDILKIQHWIN